MQQLHEILKFFEIEKIFLRIITLKKINFLKFTLIKIELNS